MNLIKEIQYFITRWKHQQVKRVKKIGFYTGTVHLLHPLHDLKPGNVVVTPRGLGVVAFRFPIRGPQASRGMVEVWLKRKYHKAYPIGKVFQYYVFNTLMDTYVPVTTASYQYLITEGEEVEYRITDRGFAELSLAEKQKRGYIPLFNNKRGGRNILRELIKRGYVIEKN